ncbi:hypothetical protein BLD44_000185 [Mastigocladus laminosus UU774]|nr:hypothetical protein BLD44_000185 [Mastigocladus laminosus UU774]
MNTEKRIGYSTLQSCVELFQKLRQSDIEQAQEIRSLLKFVEEKEAIAICFDYLMLVGLALQLNLEPGLFVLHLIPKRTSGV